MGELKLEVSELEVIKARTKAYRGPDGLKVAIVPLNTEEGAPVLIQISGVDKKYAGFVLKHEKVENSNGWLGYTTKIRGRDFYTFEYEPGRWEAKTLVRFWNDGNVYHLGYDDELAASIDPAYLLKLHNDQKEEIDKISQFNREDEMKLLNEKFEDHQKKLKEQVSHDLSFNIGWDSLSDEEIIKHSIDSWVGEFYWGFKSLHDYYPDKDKLKTIEKVHFSFGKGTKLSFKENEVFIRVDFEQSNFRDFCYYNIINNLNS